MIINPTDIESVYFNLVGYHTDIKDVGLSVR